MVLIFRLVVQLSLQIIYPTFSEPAKIFFYLCIPDSSSTAIQQVDPSSPGRAERTSRENGGETWVPVETSLRD